MFVRSLTALILIFISSPAFARLMGDWESTGDRPMQYFPTYPIDYACQAEFTDNNGYPMPGGVGRVFAVARFNLTNTKFFIRSEELTWNAVGLLEGNTSGEVAISNPPFSTEKLHFGLAFTQGQIAEADRVSLTAGISMRIGSEYVSQSFNNDFGRADDRLYLRAGMNSYSLTGEPTRSRSLYVSCTREK